jgi:hypothetical protein
MPGRRIARVEDRIWPRIDVRGPDECWCYRGGHRATGKAARIGSAKMEDGRVVALHRVVWSLLRGEIDESIILVANCTTDLCCNPAHRVPLHRRVFMGGDDEG